MKAIDEKFENILDVNKNQVFVMCCPAYFPFNYFKHPWFVLNEKGNVSRWEVRHDINKKNQNHLFINNQEPFEGINKFSFIKSKWNAELLQKIEGELAEKIIDFIKTSDIKYPYLNKYFGISGPNSNTYLNWVLSNFKEIDLILSNRFIGKNYKFDIK